MQTHIASTLLVAVTFFATPMVASAVLFDGKTVEYQYLYPDTASNYPNADNGNKVVGPGVEVSNIVQNQGTLDLSDTNIYVDFTATGGFTNSSFNGFRISDIFSNISSFSSVAINPATNMASFNASRITFDADHIWVNFQNLSFDPNTVVSLDITAIPEPSAMVLCAIMLFTFVNGFRQSRA